MKDKFETSTTTPHSLQFLDDNFEKKKSKRRVQYFLHFTFSKVEVFFIPVHTKVYRKCSNKSRKAECDLFVFKAENSGN